MVDKDGVTYYILWTLPGLLFFSTYTLLVAEWARIFHETYSARTPRFSRNRILCGVNSLFYLVQMGLFVLLFLPTGDKPGDYYMKKYRDGEPIYLGIVACLSAAFFLVYGARLYILFSRKLWQSAVKRRLVVSVFSVSAFCTVCFLTRGVVNFVWVQTVSTLHPCEQARFMVFFYLAVEILPCVAVLFVMRSMPAPARRQQEAAAALAHLPSNFDLAGPAPRDGDVRGAGMDGALLSSSSSRDAFESP